jgi:ribonuclease HI
MESTFTLYTDGACSGNPGPGGYAAILVEKDPGGHVLSEQVFTGGDRSTTNNRMEIMAVIAGLSALPASSRVQVVSDSQYVINTMTKSWKRNKNLDLWAQLDALCARHRVSWAYVPGHAGHDYNERCDRLAVAAIDQYR